MIRKIIFSSLFVPILSLALVAPVLAESTSTPAAAKPHKPQVDLACMQGAVDKRDTAIMGAVDAYSSSAKTALQTRRDALKAAWGISDRKARRDALRVAWNAFKGTWRTVSKALKTAKKSAWSQFDKDRRACNGRADEEPAGGEGADAQL